MDDGLLQLRNFVQSTPSFMPLALLVALAVTVLFILFLQKTLNKCDPASRTIKPGAVWLAIIPLVSQVFNFFLVIGVAKSLRNEFNRRGIAVADPTPGQGLGIAMSVCACWVVIPLIGILAYLVLAYLVLWIMYWVKIAGYSQMLDTSRQETTAAPTV